MLWVNCMIANNDKLNKSFYVSTNIDEELNQNFNKLVEYNVDLYHKNYYDQILQK